MRSPQRLVVALLTSLGITAQASLECPIGFGSNELHIVSDERINDNFCDCPTTGADEPETNACAGLAYWPGRGQTVDQVVTEPVFTCPQQPNLLLSVSKLQDGICDCCDGADELSGMCEDHCQELLAAERAQRAQAKEAFDVGHQKRQQAVAEFVTLTQTVQGQTLEKEAALQQLVENLEQAKLKVEEWKVDYAKARLAQVEATSHQLASNHLNALNALTNDELVDFMIHACQVAGELDGASESKTCVPLRLAGLDAGLQWEPKTYEISILRDSEQGMKVLANLFYNNVKHNKKSWSSGTAPTKSHGRRLMREEDDDAYMGDDMYREEEMYPEEDEMDDDDDDVADRLHREMEEKRRGWQGTAPSKPAGEEDDDDGGVDRDELIKSLRESSFSQSRVSFLEQSTSIFDLIEQVTKPKEDKKEESEAADSSAEGDAEEEPSIPDHDPEKLPAVKSRLEEIKKRINRGIDYGVSAKVLLGAFDSYQFTDADTKRKYLIQLAVGVLNHGKVSSVEIWQILRSVVAELRVESEVGEAETCASPWASACPPIVVTRKVTAGSIKLPDGALLKSAKDFCSQRRGADASQVCAAGNSIPSDVADGYLGYFVAEPRADTDVLSKALVSISLNLDETSKKELSMLEEAVDTSSKEKKATEDSIQELKASIGGDNPEKFGPDGELHSIKDSCFSITTGKYTYELCMFGKAKQKEGSSVGTDLGTWSEATVDEESEQRIWKWTKGAKCWNGPQRSATAHVTCGKETTILSADEPETCMYVMEVESPIACDNAYRLHHQLE